MKTIKKITLTIIATFLISFPSKSNAKNFYIANNTEKDYWIEYVYENGDIFGKKIESKNSNKIVRELHFTTMGEAFGPSDISQLKEIYIFKSYQNVKYLNGKLTNFIVKTNFIEFKNDEIDIEIIQLNKGTILIKATQD